MSGIRTGAGKATKRKRAGRALKKPSSSSGSEDEEVDTCVELNKSRVLIVEKDDGKSREDGDVLIQTIDFPHFNSTPTTNTTIYLQMDQRYTQLEVYEKAARLNGSPWKGLFSYVSGKLLQSIKVSTETEKESTSIWVLQRLLRAPKRVTQAGLAVKYVINRKGCVEFNFYMKKEQILESIGDVTPHLFETFKYKSQNVLKIIIQGPEMDADFDPLEEFDEDAQLRNRQYETNFGDFFSYVNVYKEKNRETAPEYALNTDKLNCTLMPYQKSTVSWMIHRETEKETEDPRPRWMENYEVPANHSFHYYPTLGAICRHQLDTENEHRLLKSFSLKGGILADEMGLGKTVQMLALISSHRRNEKPTIADGVKDGKKEEDELDEEERAVLASESVAEQMRIAEITFKEMNTAKSNQTGVVLTASKSKKDSVKCAGCSQYVNQKVCGFKSELFEKEAFKCPSCVSGQATRRSIGTTLIILPESLIFQWFTEISKHCSDNIRVMFYFGVKKHGYLQPIEMEQYDVILTTYDTLKSELIFTELSGPKRSLRSEEKSPTQFVASSLVHVNFWRVIVDESQMMPQGVNTHLTKMLLKIHSDNWWCVTGTPLVKSIADLGPLFTFLDVLPFSNPDFFLSFALPQYVHLAAKIDVERLVPELAPPNLLLETLARIMSRKTKEEIEDQLHIPKMEQIDKIVRFSAIEERQYKEMKEKMQSSIAKMLSGQPDSALLSQLGCRDKVLQTMRSLRETILTGQPGNPKDAGKSYTYSPDTVIFKLVHSKKLRIEECFRGFMTYAMAHAAANILNNHNDEALESYECAVKLHSEVIEVQAFIEETVGVEGLQQVLGEAADSDGDEDVDGDPVEEEQEGEMSKRERIREVAGHLKKIERMNRKYEKTGKKPEEPEEGSSSTSSPKPKRARLSTEPTKVQPANARDLEEEAEKEQEQQEEQERQNYSRRMAQLAFKPLKMDASQEVHLTMNMREVQLKLEKPEEELKCLDPLHTVFKRFYKLELQMANSLNNELASLTDMFQDDRDFIVQMASYFHVLKCRAAHLPDTALYLNRKKMQPIVELIAHQLPFMAFYTAKECEPEFARLHRSNTCVGQCVGINYWSKYTDDNCLPHEEVIMKTFDHIRMVDEQRKTIENEMRRVTEYLIEMSDFTNLLPLLSKPRDDFDENEKNIWSTLTCQHYLIKGTMEEKEGILKNHTEPLPCEICELWTKGHRLQFDAGYSSYHGNVRTKSEVLELVTYLMHHYAPTKREEVRFMRQIIRPYFERLHDFIQSVQTTALILLELVYRIHELIQSKQRLTDEQIIAVEGVTVGNGRTCPTMRRLRYATSQKKFRDEQAAKVRKELRELRYLSNLMHEQISGREPETECPVCTVVIDEYLVFTCGHRICQDCFEQMREVNRGHLFALGPRTSLPCPSCRSQNRTAEVMLARNGHAEQSSVIRGMPVSAKLTAAITLMREIIAADDTNKIILFTFIDPSNVHIWRYLLKIMTMARLPFVTMNKSSCGKKVVEFEVSAQQKIFLCSINHCANGLNMTGANHIIFLDPPENRSTLLQGIGRINRFGQKREMKVFHLVVDGSLDTELRSYGKLKRSAHNEKKGWTVEQIRAMFGIEAQNFDDLFEQPNEEALFRNLLERLGVVRREAVAADDGLPRLPDDIPVIGMQRLMERHAEMLRGRRDEQP
ncbi:unnamed protein product [Caenorhabditis sp. 36 PRJEB53466]|nr:unnamed protein product [Caenorhabditis sp. 36 PRJEB53466]